MKRIALFLCLIASTAASSFAQSDDLLPKKGDYGIGLTLNGLIDNINLGSNQNFNSNNIILGRYYLEEDFVLRAGFGFQLNSRDRSQADSSGATLIEIDSSFSNYVFSLSGGVEKHFMPSKRLDAYVFGQMDLAFIGKSNTEINRRDISGAGTARVDRTIKEDGGFALGVQGGFGFNYFVAERFSLGSELSFAIQYRNQGGAITDNEITTPINGTVTSNFSRRTDEVNQINIDVQPRANLNISYFF